MDFKHKGIAWVGNVYQKFEAVCQEVDNIISQDAVKYVENQVSSASESVKKFYSDVVQDILPPIVDPVKYEPKAVAQRGSNAYFKSLTCNKENAANGVANESSVGLGSDDLMDNQLSKASCTITFVNEEGAQVSNNSFLELNADLHLEKNNDVLIDQDLDESLKENSINELPSRKCDVTLTDEHGFMESDAVDPLQNSLRSISCKINFANKRDTLAYDDSDLQLVDDTTLADFDGVLTNKDANECSKRDATMELNRSDPLKYGPYHASSQMEFTNEEANSVFDDFHLPSESSIFPRKNDDALTDEDSDESSKKNVIMESDASDPLKNHPSHTCSAPNVNSEEATSVCGDSHLLLESEALSWNNGRPSADKYFDKSPIRNAIFEADASSCFLNQPSHACSEIGFTNKEAIVISDSNHLQLESELLSGKNDVALADKISNEHLKNYTVVENDVSYPLKNQPRHTSSSINYQNEDVTSVSNDLLLKLESELLVGNGETDASLKGQAKLEFSTESTLHCDKESVKGLPYSKVFDNACKEDIVTLTGDLQATSVCSADVESSHKVGQDSSILVNSLINSSPKMEITSDCSTNDTSCSSCAPDPTSELDSVVLTCGKILEELRPVFSFQSPMNESSSASINSVENSFSSTVVHDKLVDHRLSENFKTLPSIDVVTSAACGNKSFKMRRASSRNSLLSMQPLEEDHALRARGSAFLPEICTSRHIQFPESTSSEARIYSEVGHSYNSSGYIPDADMETVDLRDKVTPIDSCDIVDSRALHAVSRKTQKLRSYKKRIQDAFTYRRRLAKEYEQLAIWYGDTDLVFSTDSSQKLPFSAQTPLVPENAPSDSEWELL